jgi:hypothetical protein
VEPCHGGNPGSNPGHRIIFSYQDISIVLLFYSNNYYKFHHITIDMYQELFAFLLTLFVGPFAFFIFSYVVYRKSNLKKYPLNYNDGVGDMLFLPLFNASLVNLYLSNGLEVKELHLMICVFIGANITYAYYLYSFWIADYTDWSKPAKRKYNLGGWYHLTFMFIQICMIVYGIIIFYYSLYLWIPLLGYLATLAYQYYTEGYV